MEGRLSGERIEPPRRPPPMPMTPHADPVVRALEPEQRSGTRERHRTDARLESFSRCGRRTPSDRHTSCPRANQSRFDALPDRDAFRRERPDHGGSTFTTGDIRVLSGSDQPVAL